MQFYSALPVGGAALPDDHNPPARMEQLGSIYDAVHRSIKEIAAEAGISVRAMAIRFCIPRSTLEFHSPLPGGGSDIFLRARFG